MSFAPIFVIFQEDFDSVHRANMWKIVEMLGLLRKMIKVMKDMYGVSHSFVGVNQGKTIDFFNIDSEVRHRDSLPPLLLYTVYDFVMRQVELAGKGSKLIVGSRLKDLAHANDRCLLADDQ